MEDCDVHVRADVVGSCVILGTQLNVHDLSKERHFLRYRNAVTLKVRLLVKDQRLLEYSTDFGLPLVDEPGVCHDTVCQYSTGC
jgi:hypothetical protein